MADQIENVENEAEEKVEKKIEKLTPEQEAATEIYKDKWIALGLSTHTNKEACNIAADALYECAELKPPTHKLWVESPYAGCIAATLLQKFESHEGILEKTAEIMKETKTFEDYGITKSDVKAQIRTCGYGVHDASWLAFYEFCQEECDIPLEKLRGLWAYAKAGGGWYWPFEDVIIMSTLPNRIERDDEFRLFSETDMALEYNDGWGLHAWHGVRVPEWVIKHPERITPEIIDEETNIEMRRIFFEIFGSGNYMKEKGGEIVNEDAVGKLWRLNQVPNEEEPMVLVELLNSTPNPDGSQKTYFLRVSPEVKSAREAVAMSFGLDAKEYNPLIET